MTEVYIDIYIATRKSDNTNGITDEIFSLEIFTDENNSVSKFVGIYWPIYSVGDMVVIYWWNKSIGIYRPDHWRLRHFFFKLQRRDDMDFFRWFYRWNYRGIQIGIAVQRRGTSISRITDGYTDRTCPSVIPSVKASIYWLCWHSLPLFLLLLPLLLPHHPHPTSPLPNCSQPPIPTLPSSQHKYSSFLYFCT